jgi:anti-anti-sigma regulatory factor
MLNVEKDDRYGYTIIRIIDHITSVKPLKELYALLDHDIAAGKQHIAVIFSEKSIIASSIISLFFKWKRKLKQQGGRLVIVIQNPDAFETLQLLGSERIIDFYFSEESFLDKIRRQHAVDSNPPQKPSD